MHILLAFALVLGLAQVLQVAASPHASRALASAADGTGGEFIAVQGRLLDTRAGYGIGGYTTPMPANTWRTVTVDGKYGIPSSGVSAVAVTFTATNNPSDGYLKADKDEATPNATVSYLVWNANEQQSNSGVVAVGDDGKIQVMASTTTDLFVDVQGYYTSGDPAAGGYVPVTQSRLIDTRSGRGITQGQLASGSTTTIQVGGVAGDNVPSTASAVMVNFMVVDQTAAGRINPFPADATSRPATAMNFDASGAASMTATVELSSSGAPPSAIKVYVAGSAIDLTIDVLGYFTAGSPTGAFTPARQRIWDSRTTGHSPLGNNATTTIAVAGVKGVPAIGSGIGAVALNVTIFNQNGTHNSWTRAWPSGTTEPIPSMAVAYSAGDQVSNMLTLALGSDGAIQLHNIGSDAIDYAVDVEGWYTNTTSPIPSGQQHTQQSVSLQASTQGGTLWVTYRYRVGASGAYSDVPTADVKDAGGNSPSAWAVTTTGGKFTAYNWNVRNTLAALNGGVATDNLVQVVACYGTSRTDMNYACGMPANVEFAQSAFDGGFATEDVGPGTLSLVNGDFQVSANDATISTWLSPMSVGRYYTSLAPSTDNNGFGPGWKADWAGPDVGEGDLQVNQLNDSYAEFTAPDGSVTTFLVTASSATSKQFVGIGDAASSGASLEEDSSTSTPKLVMTDPDGTTTTWTRLGTDWNSQTTVSETASAGASDATTTYYYSGGFVTRILAPTPSPISCATSPDSTPGCRSLLITYETLTVAGSQVQRIQKISLSAPSPTNSDPTPLAAYDYNNAGQLITEYNPLIAPNLRTTYTYDGAGRLASLTEPGISPWTFGYDSSGRLIALSQADPTGPSAVTTVVYGVMDSGSTAPSLVSASQTATWGEIDDLPVSGVAVFSPDHQPAGGTSSTTATADWPYATIDYLDVNGQLVNSATYGAGKWLVTTSQYDANGNDVWDLTAGNRDQALSPTAQTDPYVAKLSSVDAADLLSTATTYDPLHPDEATDVFGPTHPVALSSGVLVDARTHTSTLYDEGAPSSDTNDQTGSSFDLPTTSVTDAFNVQAATDTVFPDASVTRLGYDPVVSGDPSGWSLGEPTSSTSQMGPSPSPSLDLATYARYDQYGRTVQVRLPGDAAGGTSRTTNISYYSAAASGSCADAVEAGRVCSVGPAVQPTSGKPLATATYHYNLYGEVTTAQQIFGNSGTTRTSTTQYDAAGRTTSSSVVVTPDSAGGTALPTVTYGYDPADGLSTTLQSGSGASQSTVTTAYDSLGRPFRYTDATGNVATTQYDIDGRPISIDDGKGVTSFTYDGQGSAEHRGLVTSEDLGLVGQPSALGATYDDDGNIASETYPNGVVAQFTYDNAGNATGLTYTKSGSTWMTFSDAIGSLGRVAVQTSPQSKQAYSFDPAGRLTAVQDTVGSSCVTRTYGYDAHSNRTDTSVYPAGQGGGCTTSSTPSSQRHSSYDQADRIIDSGYVYDDLGRTTTVPAVDATGSGAHSGLSGDLTLSYYANDFVAAESQNGQTQTYSLDPTQARVESFTSPAGIATTNHYSGDGDSPSWTSTTSTWVRDISGPRGELAATVSQAGVATLQLENLHGDVVATAADDTAATGPTAYSESTEFGAPRNSGTSFATYGWLGGEQRSSDSLGGTMLMGARVYDPATGRFLSPDADLAGNPNAYVYPTDPIDSSDPSGDSNIDTPGDIGQSSFPMGPDEFLRAIGMGRHQRIWFYRHIAAHRNLASWRVARSWLRKLLSSKSARIGADVVDGRHNIELISNGFRMVWTYNRGPGTMWRLDRSSSRRYNRRFHERYGGGRILHLDDVHYTEHLAEWLQQMHWGGGLGETMLGG